MVVREFSWFGHHIRLRTIVIEGEVVNTEPLRIGSGREIAKFSPIDIPILRVSDMPVIPGSTWKGVFRAACYRLGLSAGLKDLCQGIPIAQCMKGREFEYIEKNKIADEIAEKIKAIAEGHIKVCLLCLIFGSSGLSSHVHFNDSFPVGEYSIGYRRCVAIDRRTGAAHPRALYSVEYVEPGARFNFRMIIENLPNYALGLLANVLTEIQNGLVKVGGHKSRGFGTIKFSGLKAIVTPYGSGGGVVDNKLVALDPIDIDVEWPSESHVVDGGSIWKLFRNLIKVWEETLQSIINISENGWKWAMILKQSSR